MTDFRLPPGPPVPSGVPATASLRALGQPVLSVSRLVASARLALEREIGLVWVAGFRVAP